MKDFITNRRIRASFVRVIGTEGEQMGIMDTREAVRLAEGMGLDLVLMADNADPPVCRITDVGKLKYQEKKKLQAAKKKQVVIEIKEIQFRPKTEAHDLEHKGKRAIEFLGDGDKVKIVVVYRGRELEHLKVGWETLKAFITKIGDVAVIDSKPKMEGKRLTCIIGPLPQGKKFNPGHLLASLEMPHQVRSSIARQEQAMAAAGGGGVPPTGGAAPTTP
ncbi:MAG: translation initiation factor IF-3 [Bdellovibrionota bacterium]